MKQTLRLLILLMFVLGLAIPAFAQDSIGVGDEVDGEADGDPVEYEIDLEEGQVVVITLESDREDGGFDTLVRLLDADGEELAENDDIDLGSGNTNSEIEFEAEDSDTYTIVVDAFGGSPEGEFTLSVSGEGAGDADEEEMDEEEEESSEDDEPSGDADLVYDDDVDFDVDGEDELEVTFEGAAGDVVTIIARSEAEQDVLIELQDPEGDDIALYDEFNFGAAALLRIELPDDGLYTIVIEERNGEELEDEIEVEVIETELLDLGEGAQETELDGGIGRDVMFFEAEEDEIYSISVKLDGNTSSTLDVDVCEGDPNECFFSDVAFSMSGMEEAVFFFEASDDGIITLKLDYFGFGSDELEVEITVEQE